MASNYLLDDLEKYQYVFDRAEFENMEDQKLLTGRCDSMDPG